MKIIVLLFITSSLWGQTRNCQLECPVQEQPLNEQSSYELYRQRQSCLSSCEQANRQEQQIQAQEEDIMKQKEEIERQGQMLQEQQSVLKQIQEQIEDFNLNP